MIIDNIYPEAVSALLQENAVDWLTKQVYKKESSHLVTAYHESVGSIVTSDAIPLTVVSSE